MLEMYRGVHMINQMIGLMRLWLNLRYSTPLIPVVIGLGRWPRQLVMLAGKILV